MKRRFSEEQIIGILKQQESGVKTADVCRAHNISAHTFYVWKSKFGGMNVSEAQSAQGAPGQGAPGQGAPGINSKPQTASSNGLWPSKRWTISL